MGGASEIRQTWGGGGECPKCLKTPALYRSLSGYTVRSRAAAGVFATNV